MGKALNREYRLLVCGRCTTALISGLLHRLQIHSAGKATSLRYPGRLAEVWTAAWDEWYMSIGQGGHNIEIE